MEEAGRPTAWFTDVKRGDLVKVIPLWNNTCGRLLRLPEIVKVLEASSGQRSQTGTIFLVSSTKGFMMRLDADWFLPINKS